VTGKSRLTARAAQRAMESVVIFPIAGGSRFARFVLGP